MNGPCPTVLAAAEEAGPRLAAVDESAMVPIVV